MFTNSGMVQFKDVFLGTDKRPYVRAASVQACLRAGGKHNDLENVGYTARHHTFFEMLGNWSFGDYFKRDSLKWGWELLTEVYKLPAGQALGHRLHRRRRGLRHLDEGDRPAARARGAHRRQQGRAYASDNFWMMADTGPCGPCSEIFYDHGPHIPGGPPGQPGAGRRPLHRDLEPRVHAVRHAAGRLGQAAARALRGHRHGPGAPGRHPAARAQQLRDRHLRDADRRRRPRDARRRTCRTRRCA
jgi:hypothetical protein